MNTAITISQYLDNCLWLFCSGHFDKSNEMCLNVKAQNIPPSIQLDFFDFLHSLIDIRLKKLDMDIHLLAKFEYLKKKSLILGHTSIKILKIEMALNSYFGEIHGVPVVVCPLLIQNSGKILFGQACQFGYHLSTNFFSSYVQLNVRSPTGSVIIGDQTVINNGAVIVSEFSEGAGITIGKRNLIDVNFKFYDSDFHGVKKNERNDALRVPVNIGDDNFFGDNVTVLKGVSIGSGVTIAYGSTVTSNIPDNCLAAGSPAKIIRELT